MHARTITTLLITNAACGLFCSQNIRNMEIYTIQYGSGVSLFVADKFGSIAVRLVPFFWRFSGPIFCISSDFLGTNCCES